MSDFDFDSALAAQVSRQQEGAAPDPEATEDDIIEKYGTNDDVVVPVDDDEVEVLDEEEIVEEEVEDDDSDEPAPDEDPVVAEFVARFGGDRDKALKTAAHQTSMLGKQGQELGELRQMVTQLQQIQIQQQTEMAPAPIAPGQFDDAIEEDPGAVAQWAFVNGQESVYEEAVGAWYEVDPKSAARFERAVEMEALKTELEQKQQAPSAPDRTSVVTAMNEKFSDFSQVVSTATPAELEGLDRETVGALEARNPAAAFEMVYKWVKASRPAAAVTVSQDEADAAERAAQATRTAKREASAVARGTSRPASGDTSTMDKLKESMLSPDPFNVQHGLHSAG